MHLFVGRLWHRPVEHAEARRVMTDNLSIALVLFERGAEVAPWFEAKLYDDAVSFAAYSDLTTIHERLRVIGEALAPIACSLRISLGERHMREHLRMLRHGYDCKLPVCGHSFCAWTRSTWRHLVACHIPPHKPGTFDALPCAVACCEASREVLNHYLGCRSQTCAICVKPLTSCCGRPLTRRAST